MTLKFANKFILHTSYIKVQPSFLNTNAAVFTRIVRFHDLTARYEALSQALI